MTEQTNAQWLCETYMSCDAKRFHCPIVSLTQQPLSCVLHDGRRDRYGNNEKASAE